MFSCICLILIFSFFANSFKSGARVTLRSMSVLVFSCFWRLFRFFIFWIKSILLLLFEWYLVEACELLWVGFHLASTLNAKFSIPSTYLANNNPLSPARQIFPFVHQVNGGRRTHTYLACRWPLDYWIGST